MKSNLHIKNAIIGVTKTVAKIVLSLIFLVSIFYLLGYLLTYALENNAVQDCSKLQAQSKQGYIGFYITPAQKEVCDSVHISIEAPIETRHEK